MKAKIEFVVGAEHLPNRNEARLKARTTKK